MSKVGGALKRPNLRAQTLPKSRSVVKIVNRGIMPQFDAVHLIDCAEALGTKRVITLKPL